MLLIILTLNKTCTIFPTVNTGYSYTYKFSDTNCEVPTVQIPTALTGCKRIVGGYGSSETLCTTDAGKLPLPGSNFSTEM